MSIHDDGAEGSLSDGLVVFAAEYTGERCRKITFKKTGYVSVNIYACDRQGTFAVLVTVEE